jgi:hypothetical protein
VSPSFEHHLAATNAAEDPDSRHLFALEQTGDKPESIAQEGQFT